MFQVMSLSKALKAKNRLIGAIKRAESDIGAHNSVLAGGDWPILIADLMDKRNLAVGRLVQLKAAISAGNAPIQANIYELSEMKSTIKFLRELDVKEGVHELDSWRGGGGTADYKAIITKRQVDEQVESLLRLMDQIQDTLDQHNHSTTIQIDWEGEAD